MDRMIEILFLLLLTGLLAADFEIPMIYLPVFLTVALLVGWFLSGMKRMNHQLGFTAYLLLLIGCLSLLGGRSTSGISFENPYLWIMLTLSLGGSLISWRKASQSENE